MKIYKVIKNFGNARKGDLFEEIEGEDVYTMERVEGEDNISDDTEHYMKTWVSMELSKGMIDAYADAGFLVEMKNNDECCNCEKMNILKEYIDILIDTYEKDHKDMLEAFENGDVQPCVKVEAETVYYNMIKILNSIKDKINE